MSYQVTARKWRPMIFEDVVGQSHVTSTLKNALAAHRIAHAYIFSGTRGCGKTTTARILARAVNCESPVNNNPDNTCSICTEIIAGRGLDVIEIDGASNRGIEEIRNLRDSVRFTPTRGAYKIYIIDEVHMLTKEAFNALLKTLEEPPAHVIFVFATTEIHKVPMTILSRCQRFDFRRIATQEVVKRLSFIAKEEKVTIDEEALTIIARKGDGSMRDAQSIFDQVYAFCGETITEKDVLSVLNVVDTEMYFRCSSLVRSKDGPGVLALVDGVVKSGYDLREFVVGLSEHYRNLLVVRSTGSSELVETSSLYKKRYEEESKTMAEGDLLRILHVVHQLESTLRFAHQPRYKLETTMLQLAHMESTVVLEDLVKRLEEVKRSPGTGTSATPQIRNNAVSREAPLRSNVQVVGPVNAGPMTSSVAERYSAFFGRHSASMPAAGIPVAVTSGAPSTAVDPQADGRIAERWEEIVSDVMKTRIAIGTTLHESIFLDVQNGAVRIGCPDDYHVATLSRHKEFLSEAVFRVVGARVLVEPVLHKPSVITYQPSHVEEPRKSVIETQENRVSTDATDHPVVAALKKELGAERVE